MLARLRRRSELDRVIAPEIKDDAFYESIIRVASMPGLSHILEIGASSGTGSTEASSPESACNPRLRRCTAWRCLSRATGHWLSATAISVRSLLPRLVGGTVRLPSVDEVASAWRAGDPPLRTQLRWLRQDIDYITEHDVPQSAIDSIKEEFAIDSFMLC